MTARSAPLLTAALACLAGPAFAQDGPGTGDALTVEEAAEAAPVPGRSSPGTGDAFPADEVAEAADGYGPTATRALDPAAMAATNLTPERLTALEQCRGAYVAAGGAAASALAGCEAHLQQFERTAAPGAAAPYGSVMWVRVPIMRQPVAPTIDRDLLGDVPGDAPAE